MHCRNEFFVRLGGGVKVVDRCMKIEHARFFGGLSTLGLNTGVVSARRLHAPAILRHQKELTSRTSRESGRD